MFWNHKWKSAQWRALCTQIVDVNLSSEIYVHKAPNWAFYHVWFQNVFKYFCFKGHTHIFHGLYISMSINMTIFANNTQGSKLIVLEYVATSVPTDLSQSALWAVLLQCLLTCHNPLYELYYFSAYWLVTIHSMSCITMEIHLPCLLIQHC